LKSSDFIIEKGIELPELTIDNTVMYISDVEPYGVEELRTPYEYCNLLLDNYIAEPIYYEDLIEDEYKDYDYIDIKELYKKEEFDISLYCDINYDKLKLYYELIS
jgi:hypothetical protein